MDVENSFAELRNSGLLQASPHTELIACTHTRCNDHYIDLDSAEIFTLLQPNKAKIIEV